MTTEIKPLSDEEICELRQWVAATTPEVRALPGYGVGRILATIDALKREVMNLSEFRKAAFDQFLRSPSRSEREAEAAESESLNPQS